MLPVLFLGVVIVSELPDMEALLKQVSPQNLRNTVEKLASFHTRNTLSPTMVESAEWLASEYRKLPRIQVELMQYTLPKGRRVPEDKEVVQVVATLPGKTHRRIIVGGHLDSLNLQVDPITGRAPGANDDASGTALALELARIMSKYEWEHTLMFVGFTGEEQGLHGARALAKLARDEGWVIDAMLNNDTVGSSSNKLGQKDDKNVRVFSEESFVGGLMHPQRPPHKSRELARWIEWVARKYVEDFGVKLVMRSDRFGRGGDHTPFNEHGYNAVRFIEVYEEYSRQHTPDDLPEYMDWNYLANVSRVNLATMALLANAGTQPEEVQIVRNQSHHTTLTWKALSGTQYVVYWRDTASAVWQGSRVVGEVGQVRIENVNKDDHFFAVGAVGGIPVVAQ